MKKEDDTPFAGFPLPKKNFFSMPNEIINIISNITNMAELKVIIYVIRHTWGFHEYGICKTISTDEFMRGRRKQDGTRMDQGTGLSNRSVIDGLRSAVEHGYLVCEIDTSDIARTVKSYTLKMATPCEGSSQGEEPSYPPCEESSQGPMKNLHTAYEEPSHRSEKDTKERHLKKDSIEERENPSAHRDARASAHTPSASSSEQKLQQIIEDKTANGVGSPPAPSKEATNGQEAIQANLPGAHKRTRRPKPEIDAQTHKRIDLVVEALNGMKQEVTGDPEAHYFVFQKDTEAIVEKLLPQSPTPTKLRRVFLDMWNEKDRNGNYFWRKRMKIHNICNEYESRMMGLEGKTPTPSNSDGPSALVAAGYTNNHTPKAGEPLIKFKPLVRRT